MTYIPKRENKAKNLSLLCIVTGFILMMLSSVLPYRIIFQAAALAAVSAGVFLLQRYVLCEYRYIIVDREDGSADLVIYRKQGKNDVKMCHISLLNVEDVYRPDEKNIKCAARYAYNQNMTDNKYVLVASDGEKRIEIIIEPDDAFLRQIRERVGGGGGTLAFAM